MTGVSAWLLESTRSDHIDRSRRRGCSWANAIVSGGVNPGRPGRVLRRQGDHAFLVFAKWKAIVRPNDHLPMLVDRCLVG
jgi:hypothetical protein